MENKVINVQMDEETFKKFQSGGEAQPPTELKRNDVNFFDYDGTLLYAYTWDEAKELTELPALPTHENLEVREWNYTLEDIKAQGVSGFSDIYGSSYIYAEDVVVEGVKYRAFSQTGSLEGKYTMTVYLLTKEPKIGDFAIGASYYGGDNWELWYNGDSLYQSEIIDVFSTIGKADIGACCYDKDGEQVMTNGTYIIERGIVSINNDTLNTDYSYKMAKVMSVPATVTNVGNDAFAYFTIEHLRMPINIEYELYYGRAFKPMVIRSFWINGCDLDTNIIDGIEGLSITHIPHTFNTFRQDDSRFKDSLITYVPETIHTINNFSSPNKTSFVIFNNHKFVPTLTDFAKTGSAVFIVPDVLYDEWINSTNWSTIFNSRSSWTIKKLSEYSYLIK